MSRVIDWHFPLLRTHTGIPLGNGVQGLLVWGSEKLQVTISRQGFWDRRGDNPVLDSTTYADVRRMLEQNDQAGLRRLFDTGTLLRPRQVGGGRLTLAFGNGLRPRRASLDLCRSTAVVQLESADGRASLRIGQHPTDEYAWIESDDPAVLDACSIQLLPAFDTCREGLATALGWTSPHRWGNDNGGGFAQATPQDQSLAVAWQRHGRTLLIATALGERDVREQAEHRLSEADADVAQKAAEAWWSAYWRDVPEVHLPDADLQRVYHLGCYKQACLTPPHAPAATLQGCWMEEYQLPPWSNDYHFNINVQLVYSACLPTNRAKHLAPLWSMVRSWFPRLRTYGRKFFGRDGAMLVPHAVDDRGLVIGQFWSGTIDHACTAWVGQMAWRHYRHTLDATVLSELAWPLLIGAFEGFWSMLDEASAGTFSLPVSVSPEYNRDGTTAGQWGRDSSFQLAAAHMTARLLIRAAAALERDADPRWQILLDRLPPYAVVPDERRPAEGRISIWAGHDLARSHRHHSHLAGLWPFCTVDPFAPQHNRNVGNAIRRWTHLGAGEWAGWSVPWASLIFARLGLANPAVLWLKWWAYGFCNEGHSSLHNADFPGVSEFDDGALTRPDFHKEPGYAWEIMQADAAIAAVTAICELLVQCRVSDDGTEVLYVLPAGLPKGWRDLEFDGVLAEGGFLLGATVTDGRITEVRVTSRLGQPLCLRLPFQEEWTAPDGGHLHGNDFQMSRTVVGSRLCFRQSTDDLHELVDSA